MEEPLARAMMRIGRAIDEAVDEHEQRCDVPKPQRRRVQAIPFPTVQLTDVQLARAIEMLECGAALVDAAVALDVPTPALERGLAEWQPRWREFLAERASG